MIKERTMMIEDVEKQQFIFIFDGFRCQDAPSLKSAVGPAPALHKHFQLKV